MQDLAIYAVIFILGMALIEIRHQRRMTKIADDQADWMADHAKSWENMYLDGSEVWRKYISELADKLEREINKGTL